METWIAWAGFAGAWLLFAGPIFQASVELGAEDEVTRARDTWQDLPQPAPVSGWWWLFPPAHMVLSSRRRDRHREAVMSRLSPEQREAVTRYIKIARGWMYVALGAWLIAWKETWELVEHEEWPTAVFWVLIVVMSMAALGLTVATVARDGDMQERIG